MYNNIKDVINQIFTLEGIEVLKNRNKFFSLLADLAPNLVEERKILSRSLTEGSMRLIYKVLESENVEISNQFFIVQQYFVEELGLNEKWSQFTIDCFFQKNHSNATEELDIINTWSIENNQNTCFETQQKLKVFSFDFNKRTFIFDEVIQLESYEILKLSNNTTVLEKMANSCNGMIEISEGEVHIFADEFNNIIRLKNCLDVFLNGPEVGSVFRGIISKIDNETTYVELVPGVEGFIDIHELDIDYCTKPEDVINVGSEVIVKVLSVDADQVIILSRRQAQIEIEGLTPKKDNLKNQTDTFENIKKLSEKGNLCAQYIMSYCYKRGKYVSENRDKSLTLIRSAASKGFIPAQYEYAYMILSSFEKESFLDQVEAKRMLNLAIKNEHVLAIELYGRLLMSGGNKNIEIDKNLVLAIEQFEKIAACSLNPNTQNIINMYYDITDMCEGIDDLYEVMKSSRDCFERDVKFGQIRAKHHLGTLLLDKKYGPKEHTRGIKLLEETSKQDDFLAAYELGWYYENNCKFYTDISKADEWYHLGEKIASKLDHGEHDRIWFKKYKSEEDG